MKIFLDFFPILLFFIAYKFGDIYIATITAIAASLIQVIYGKIKHGRFEKLSLVTFGVILLLGGATLLFRDEMFIKWKPTVVYWLLALAFLLSQFIGSKPFIQRAAEQNIQLSNIIWRRLNFSWVIFFAIMGLLNLYVVQNYDTNTWVNFKLFGTLGLTLIFVIFQTVYMVRHMKKGNTNNPNSDGIKNTKIGGCND